jgi:hypothetical protein
MPLLGLDYAGGVPSAAAIKAAGYGFVARYLTDGGPGLPGKLLKKPEYDALVAADVAVVVNYETTADRMKRGYAAGVDDATSAQATLEGIGYPADERPVMFSADWDATESDQVAIDSYLRGAASVIGVDRVGIYGGYYVVKRCLDNGTATWAWQAGAWSGGQIEPRAHIYQHIVTVVVDGIPCDVNEAMMRPDFGQHPYTRVARQEDDNVQNFFISGKGRKVIICPTGSASADRRLAWLSASTVAMTGPGQIDVYAQSDAAGVNAWTWDDKVLTPNKDNLTSRAWVEVKDGTTHMVITWDLTSCPEGATLCLETRATV